MISQGEFGCRCENQHLCFSVEIEFISVSNYLLIGPDSLQHVIPFHYGVVRLCIPSRCLQIVMKRFSNSNKNSAFCIYLKVFWMQSLTVVVYAWQRFSEVFISQKRKMHCSASIFIWILIVWPSKCRSIKRAKPKQPLLTHRHASPGLCINGYCIHSYGDRSFS